MIKSLLICLHHHVTALILNLGTVGTKVFTSSPGNFSPGNDTSHYWVEYCVGAELVYMSWGKEKVLTLSEFSKSIPP